MSSLPIFKRAGKSRQESDNVHDCRHPDFRMISIIAIVKPESGAVATEREPERWAIRGPKKPKAAERY
jgi:hypothetical protein